MADTIDVSCPSCGKSLQVPGQFAGKRIKCKGCGTVIPVPSATPPVEESGAKPEAPAATKEKGRVTWDDEADNDNAAMGVIHEDEAPRCPHCAQLLIPPDAVVCVHCGFNNRTRVRAETKKVYEPEPAEWTAHLAPGVLAFVGVMALLILDLAVLKNMRYWMEDGMLETDEIGFDGNKKMLISPGLFITMCFFISIIGIVPLLRIWYRRLFINFMPPEQAMQTQT